MSNQKGSTIRQKVSGILLGITPSWTIAASVSFILPLQFDLSWNIKFALGPVSLSRLTLSHVPVSIARGVITMDIEIPKPRFYATLRLHLKPYYRLGRSVALVYSPLSKSSDSGVSSLVSLRTEECLRLAGYRDQARVQQSAKSSNLGDGLCLHLAS